LQTQEVCELVKPSGVRGEITVSDLLIPTLTETRIIVGYGVYHLRRELGNRKRTRAASGPTPVSCYSSFVGGVCYSGSPLPVTPTQRQTILQREFSPPTLQPELPLNTLSPLDVSLWADTQTHNITARQFAPLLPSMVSHRSLTISTKADHNSTLASKVVPKPSLLTKYRSHTEQLEMWANAQRHGRPAEYTSRPPFNAANFG